MRTAADPLSASPPQLGEADLERIKRSVEFTEEDARLLKALLEDVRPCADAIVDQFYQYLLRDPYARSFIEDPDILHRLLLVQKDYLLSLFGGTYDEAYFSSRLRIGEVHARLRLDHGVYFGAYALYRKLLYPIIVEKYREDPGRLLRSILALERIINIDIQLATLPYLVARALQAEETVRRQQEELVRSAQMAAVGELAAGIAHELRNPLAGIGGAIDIIGGALPPDHPHRQVIKEIKRQILRLDKTVKDLLDFARPRPPKRESTDLHQLLDTVLNVLTLEPRYRQVSIERTFDLNLPPIEGDPQQLQQVFFNILLNAVQAVEGSGTVTIQTGLENGRAKVLIQDTGPGIPPEHIGRIFEPFFTTKHQGTGLGLPISRQIVETHGGSLSLSTTVQQGTAVTILLPVSSQGGGP